MRLACAAAAVLLMVAAGARADDKEDAALRRALGYLAREVPKWSRENRCYSCHNNGDAARALLAADGPFAPPAEALRDTLDWLARPERWDANRLDPAVSDKALARLQFAAALALAVERGRIRDRAALMRAARRVAEDQSVDGSWAIGDDGIVGAPATYGRPLATALALRPLATADRVRFGGPIERAERWLRARPVENVLEASAVLIGLPDGDVQARRRGFDFLRKAQSDRGGWGPFVRSPPEPFDTALALLALGSWPERAEARPSILKGRAYLVAAQNDDGSWPETTRPPGGESYAERLSTAGWATLALLATRDFFRVSGPPVR